MIFFIFLIYGVIVAVVKVSRTTGIELAATKDLLIGRYGKDAMCVPLEKLKTLLFLKTSLEKSSISEQFI